MRVKNKTSKKPGLLPTTLHDQTTTDAIAERMITIGVVDPKTNMQDGRCSSIFDTAAYGCSVKSAGFLLSNASKEVILPSITLTVLFYDPPAPGSISSLLVFLK